MIIIEWTFAVEPDTGHAVTWFRWVCCTCGDSSSWLLDADTADELAASHASNHQG